MMMMMTPILKIMKPSSEALQPVTIQQRDTTQFRIKMFIFCSQLSSPGQNKIACRIPFTSKNKSSLLMMTMMGDDDDGDADDDDDDDDDDSTHLQRTRLFRKIKTRTTTCMQTKSHQAPPKQSQQTQPKCSTKDH